MDKRIPVTVLTGFLGSGKTTLLQTLLKCKEGSGVAVIINELGEVALDHLFVQKLTESAIVLKNGCICCTIREDLQTGLHELIDGLYSKNAVPFNRIVIETTGMADPTPIAMTLDSDLMLNRQVRLANIIATVDAIFGAEQIDSYAENLRQVAIADRIVLTKTDIATFKQISLAKEKIHKVNPTAMILDANKEKSLWHLLFDIDPFDPNTKSSEVQQWLTHLPNIKIANSKHYHKEYHNNDSVETFSIQTQEPLKWMAFAVWLSALLHRHGKNILRIKGLLNIPDALGPVVLNTVQNHIAPPMHLDKWLDDDHSSRIVFIVQGISPNMIYDSLDVFLKVLNKR